MSFANATNLAVTEINRTTPVDMAAALTAVDGANGNKFDNNGRTVLRVKNTNVTTVTVTVETPGTVDGLAIADLAFTVALNEDKLIGNFPAIFNQPGTSQVYVSWSHGNNVTAKVLRVANDS